MKTKDLKNSNVHSNNAENLKSFSHIRKIQPVKTLNYKPKTTGISCVPLGGAKTV